jgi:hypothetical protein
MTQRLPKSRANSDLSNLVEEGGRSQRYPRPGSTRKDVRHAKTDRATRDHRGFKLRLPWRNTE